MRSGLLSFSAIFTTVMTSTTNFVGARSQGRYDVFGDGAITIMPTPGHTPGHQSLCVVLLVVLW